MSQLKFYDIITLDECHLSSAYHLLQTKSVRSNLFEYTPVNKEFCGKNNTEIDLLIFITSKSNSYERRNAIRRTYGSLNNIFKYTHDTSSRLEVRILFMINLDENRMKSILFEQKLFNDIIQVKLKKILSNKKPRLLFV
jgi:hypothetical protein